MGLREYQHRIQHVHKSAHAKYELCSCQGLPGAAKSCQQRPLGAKIQETLVPSNPRSHAIFQIFRSISCFWMFNWWPFTDLINSKDCTHEYNILNFSDLKKVDKTFFKNTKYQSEKNTYLFSKIILCHIYIYVLYVYYMCIIYVLYMYYIICIRSAFAGFC